MSDRSSQPTALNEARQSLTDRAYSKLEELIVTLELEPGSVLSEQALVERLKIGRTPVREALQRLAREGLVTIRPRKGVIVADINMTSHLKMLEVRRELERLMARKAAERGSTEQRAAFATLAQDMHDTVTRSDDLAFIRLDAEFNALINETAGNEFASNSIALMAGLSRRFWYLYSQRAPGLTTMAKRHIAVAEAIAAADADAAASASDALLDYVESISRNAIDW